MEHPSAFRSFSTQSTSSVNSINTASSSRVVSSGTLNLNNFNKQSSPKDHLFYQCECLKRKLEKIPGMEPFLNSAFNQAEQYSEQQALALAQERTNNNNSSNNHTSLDGAMNRLSIGSDSSSVQSSLTRLATNASSSSSVTNLPTNNNLLTFTAGILPANISVDPATQLWKLFQQGAPLCVIFNFIIPEYQIPVISSDDLRICKKSVYDFLIAVKTHLNFEDEDMFTISNVFSDSTQDLLKIIVVVNKLLSKKASSAAEFAAIDEEVCVDVQITDERSKVFREIIETERKYVQDLELMCKYRQELIDAENLSSEQVHLLFPNINEIIDFQRRFLNGLECNINIPIRYQRIGSVFIHASLGPFNAYEPWTIGQLAAIDLISKESANLKKSSTLIDPGFELQSYILKPIQRLCKYPLLLKELIKTSPESTNEESSASSAAFNELLVARTAMKELANQVNEAQRRAENIEHLAKLKERVGNWRGFNLDAQGELLFHGHVGVKDADAEKEYVAYLFEKIIFFFIEIDDKKTEKVEKKSFLSTRKKSTSNTFSNSTANLLESINNARRDDTLPLELKGRVYISEIYNISAPATPGSTLIISWSGKKENGSFTLRYRSEEIRNQWEKCLRDLKTSEMNTQIHRKLRDSDSSLNTNDSSIYDYTGMSTSPTSQPIQQQQQQQQFYDQRASHGSRHHSSSSTLSMMKSNRVKSGDMSRLSSSSTTLGSFSNNNNTSPNTTAPSSTSSETTRVSPSFDVVVKLLYKSVELPEALVVPAQIQFTDLLSRIIAKILTSKLVNEDVKIGRLRYKDDEGDFVNLNSDDDWGLVLDMLVTEGSYMDLNDERRVVTVWVS
ncbi:Guanine nucleotide exchange factor Cdc24 [Candida maltosa Xu316]|uniref:Guanine nucleotide exchange factor Cdc24 n=1 Tax=Candida maltosa (strain Xu316) TaxID=1245528 RepID=M3J399_CANMX|nr:Guanine nucleotide exchange factor Cdc24 [Candida maltosa Xu316]